MNEYKEIHSTLSEIKERTASMEAKVDLMLDQTKKIDNVKDIAVKAKDSASSAHKRIDKIDKWMFALGSTLLTAIILAVLSLILIT